MNDVVNFLYTYLDDPAEIMSKARVLETINEIESLIKDRDDWLDRYLNSQARRHEALMEAEDAKEESDRYKNALALHVEGLKRAYAERDAWKAEAEKWIQRHIDLTELFETAEAERDELRELLREAKNQMWGDLQTYPLRSRIDAALKG